MEQNDGGVHAHMRPQPDTEETAWAMRTAELPKDELKAQLEIYDETILLRGFDKDQAWVRTVSADEIARIFIEHLGFSSGLLPPNTLWWGQGDSGHVVGLWRAPKVWPVALQREPFKPPERLRLPMPGLVFICASGRPPWVYAAKKRPTDENDVLYKIPTFNVFRDGRVCSGSHHFPDDVTKIPESFFESYFSMTGDSSDRSQKYPDDLLKWWDRINGRARYPLSDLVPHCTVGQAIATGEGKNVIR